MSALTNFFSWLFPSPPAPAPASPPPAPAPTIECGIMAPQFGVSAYEHRAPGLNEFAVEADGYMEGATVTFLARAPVGTTLNVTMNVTQCDFFINGQWVSVIPGAKDYKFQPSAAQLPFHAAESGGYRVGLLLSDYYDGPAADRKATRFRFRGTMDIAVR